MRLSGKQTQHMEQVPVYPTQLAGERARQPRALVRLRLVQAPTVHRRPASWLLRHGGCVDLVSTLGGVGRDATRCLQHFKRLQWYGAYVGVVCLGLGAHACTQNTWTTRLSRTTRPAVDAAASLPTAARTAEQVAYVWRQIRGDRLADHLQRVGTNSLRPVTIRQLLNASQPHSDAQFTSDGAELSQVRTEACGVRPC